MQIHKTFKIQHWSGGTTTELFIYPLESSLKALDFEFRLSLATIETPESTFTPLPGVHRHFMVLDGNIHLNHKDQHDSTVEAFQQDHFEGDWHTASKGTASVFNLMYISPVKATIEHLRLNKGEKGVFDKNGGFKLLVYLHNGQIDLTDSNKILEAQELLELNAESTECQAVENSNVVVVRVNMRKP